MTDPTRPPASQPPPPPPPPAGDGTARRYLSARRKERTPLSGVSSPYGLVIAALAVLISIAPNLVIVAVGGMPEGTGGTAFPEGPELLFGLIVSLVLMLIMFGLALLPVLTAGRPYARLLGPTRGTPMMWAIGIGVGIVTVIVAYTVNAVAVLVFGDGTTVEQGILESASQGGPALVLVVLIAVVIGPITEEVIYRGVFFRALADKVGMWAGATLSAAVFAVVHVEVVFSQPLALAGLFVVGLLLALAYHRTGSLLVPIVGHAVFNAVSVLLALLADQLEVPTAAGILLGPLTGLG